MLKSTAFLFTAATLAISAYGEEATFKAYGFADVELIKQDFKSNNFLVQIGAIDPNAQLYLDHLNTYLDWKPNANVRVLAEISYNPYPVQAYTSGTLLRADSAAIYASLYKQVGAQTEQGFLQYLRSISPPGTPDNILLPTAQALAQDTLSKSTHSVVQGIQAYGVATRATKSNKDHGISLPRVQADLLVRDEFNVRVGKFITPSGIWNVDHGSPAIITIKQPYETSFLPIFPESQTGMQLFGHTSAGDHDLSYASWVTTGRSGTSIQGTGDFAQEPVNLDDWAVGAHLQADLAYLDGIRLGGTLHTGTMRQSSEWATIPVIGIDQSTNPPTPITDLAGESNARVDSSYMRENIFGLDTKIQWKGFLLQAEWNHRQVLNLQANRIETNFNAGYVLLAKRFPLGGSFDVTPYVLYENLTWSTPENNPGLGLVGTPISGFSDYLAGLNFGLFNNVRLKLEYSFVELQAVPASSGQSANTYTNSDLAMNQYAAQFSVAF